MKLIPAKNFNYTTGRRSCLGGGICCKNKNISKDLSAFSSSNVFLTLEETLSEDNSTIYDFLLSVLFAN